MVSALADRASLPRLDLRIALLLAFGAIVYAAVNAWLEHEARHLPFGVDGLDEFVQRMQVSGRSIDVLLRDPSIWKGPIVPFWFGLAYFVVPSETSPLALNALAFGAAGALFFVVFRSIGVDRVTAAAAVGAWILYLPHRYLFAYYFAEPLLSLLVATVSLLVVRLIATPTSGRAAAAGIGAGILLLARAPYLLAVIAVAILIWARLSHARARLAAIFLLAIGLTMTPWILRNVIVFDAFVPFTTEGGKVLFQGVWLPGDDVNTDELRAMPEWRAIESQERGLSPIEQYRFWQQKAKQAALSDPIGQVRLMLRKAIRFWVYLPQFSWMPAAKTAAVAVLCLPLAVLGFAANRHVLRALLPACWFAGLWVFHSIVHSELRYNFPVLPFAFLLAGLGVERLLLVLRRNRLGAAH